MSETRPKTPENDALSQAEALLEGLLAEVYVQEAELAYIPVMIEDFRRICPDLPPTAEHFIHSVLRPYPYQPSSTLGKIIDRALSKLPPKMPEVSISPGFKELSATRSITKRESMMESELIVAKRAYDGRLTVDGKDYLYTPDQPAYTVTLYEYRDLGRGDLGMRYEIVPSTNYWATVSDESGRFSKDNPIPDEKLPDHLRSLEEIIQQINEV